MKSIEERDEAIIVTRVLSRFSRREEVCAALPQEASSCVNYLSTNFVFMFCNILSSSGRPFNPTPQHNTSLIPSDQQQCTKEVSLCTDRRQGTLNGIFNVLELLSCCWLDTDSTHKLREILLHYCVTYHITPQHTVTVTHLQYGKYNTVGVNGKMSCGSYYTLSALRLLHFLKFSFVACTES